MKKKNKNVNTVFQIASKLLSLLFDTTLKFEKGGIHLNILFCSKEYELVNNNNNNNNSSR